MIEEEYNDGLLQAYSADWEFYKQRIAMAVTYRPYAETIPSGLARPVIHTIAFEYVCSVLYVLLLKDLCNIIITYTYLYGSSCMK